MYKLMLAKNLSYVDKQLSVHGRMGVSYQVRSHEQWSLRTVALPYT